MITLPKKFRLAINFLVTSLFLAAVLALTSAAAQSVPETDSPPRMSQTSVRDDGAVLNRVMLTVLGVWAALAAYLIIIDRKLSRLERDRE